MKQLEQMIKQLKSRDRIALIQKLSRKGWGERFRALVTKIDKRRKQYPVTQNEILHLVKEARRDRYHARRA
jgi:predicted patatin/cPLA2 family phospholipase